MLRLSEEMKVDLENAVMLWLVSAVVVVCLGWTIVAVYVLAYAPQITGLARMAAVLISLGE
jgi:predicted benzoate:H+ symporter BenE